jgi:8-amino-7-oxononanoate synthase
VISDKECHASLIDGILLSRAKHHRHRHNDLGDMTRLLEQHTHTPSLLITESVFSMEGNIVDLHQHITQATAHHASLIVDDAHGIGVLGKTGKGILEHLNLSHQDIACLVVPLGKAFGSMGAIVSGSADMIESLLQSARPYRYSTALPAAVCAATLAALKIVQTESWRREKLMSLIECFHRESKARHLPLISYDNTPIKCILTRSNALTVALQQYLMNEGYFTSCIRPPTVPAQCSRIRLSLNCTQTEEMLTRLLDHIADYLSQYSEPVA